MLLVISVKLDKAQILQLELLSFSVGYKPPEGFIFPKIISFPDFQWSPLVLKYLGTSGVSTNTGGCQNGLVDRGPEVPAVALQT